MLSLSAETLALEGGNGEDDECWCPCRCGCRGAELLPHGLCQDCVDGNHEVPPEGALPSLEDLCELHRSILDCYARAAADRG